MSEVSLSGIDALYSLSDEPAIHYCHVEHALFRAFCRSSRALIRQLGDEANDPNWIDLTRSLKRYRFVMSAAPLSFNDPGAEPRFSPVLMRSLVARIGLVYPGAVSVARETVELYMRLRQCEDNPCLDCMETLFGQQSAPTALLVRDSRVIQLASSALKTRDALSTYEVVGLEGVRGKTTYDKLIVMGPASWYPDYVFRAPRSGLIYIVGYRWNRIRWQPKPTFVGCDGGFERLDEAKSDLESDTEFDESWPGIDWSLIARHGIAAISDDQDERDHDMVSAYLFVLHGGYAVFLDASDGSHCLAIDPRDHAEAQVKQIDTQHIEPGMFVLMRTEGGGNYIVPVADKILGERANEHRAAQEHWKLRLRNHVVRAGLLETCLELLDLGSLRANETNLRNWMSGRTIGTERENDFVAIMRLVGLADEAERYWKITRVIKAAHLRAGKAIRRRLIEQVANVDVADLERKGTFTFELPDAEGGRLTAFRVESRAPTTMSVPVSRLDRVFARED